MANAGDQIGPFVVEAELGRGGMGVVYRARDTRLDRMVAIKALPEHLAADPERLARFEVEARSLAQITHPNIAGIHGVEEHAGTVYLILEYVEGQTLADLLERGPLPTADALELAVQIAAGLEAAHEAGVIHRDLKPANIIVTPDREAKVLDFGLSRAEDGASSTNTMHTSSLTSPAAHSPTMPGVVLGTAAYMSPEQARGRRVDRRTDIWSFGVVLYEMLVGVSPFLGETVSDSIGAILHKDLDLAALPPAVPASVRRVLGRCLTRNKADRYRDIGDTRYDLVYAHEHGDSEASAGLAAGHRTSPVAWAVAAVAVLVALGLGAWTAFSPEPVSAIRPGALAERFEADITPRNDLELDRRMAPIRLSPDGTRLAYLATRTASDWVICVRDLRSGEETELRGPERPLSPVWSPDGRYLAYFSGNRLEQIAIDGGQPEFLTETKSDYLPVIGDWHENGLIAYSTARSRLMLYDTGTGERIESIDPIPGRGGDWAVYPSFLPDGEHVLYLNQDDVAADAGLYVGSIADGSSKRLLAIETAALFLEPDTLLFWRGGDVFRQRFNTRTLELEGEPTPVVRSVLRRDWPMFASISATRDTLAYIHDSQPEYISTMVVLDIETGIETPLGIEGSLWTPRVSPDGASVVFDRTVDSTAGDIVIHNFETGAETMLSRHPSNESGPIWSPDLTWVYFFRGSEIYRARSDGTGVPVPVLSPGKTVFPQVVTADGTGLVFSIGREDGGAELRIHNLETGEDSVLLESSGSLGRGSLRTDGKLLAYSTSINGERRTMIKFMDDNDPGVLLSPGRSGGASWAGDRLFAFSNNEIIAVDVTTSGRDIIVSRPAFIADGEDVRHLSAFPDGNRLLLIRDKKPLKGGSVRVVKNWLADGAD